MLGYRQATGRVVPTLETMETWSWRSSGDLYIKRMDRFCEQSYHLIIDLFIYIIITIYCITMCDHYYLGRYLHDMIDWFSGS